MTRKQVRNFSAEEKTKIVLELLKEEVIISQLSSKYKVSSNRALLQIGIVCVFCARSKICGTVANKKYKYIRREE